MKGFNRVIWRLLPQIPSLTAAASGSTLETAVARFGWPYHPG